MKASIIFNPKAGTHDLQSHIQQAGDYLKNHGWQLTWCETQYAHHATQLAREVATRGDDIAVAIGGDGTVNEVMNGLVGSKTMLGILPAGTANVFAVDMNIPVPNPVLPNFNTIIEAAQHLIHGQVKAIDTAKVTCGDGKSRYFLLWAGIGLDAAVTQTFEKHKSETPHLKRLGMARWIGAVLSVIGQFRGTPTKIIADEKIIEGNIILTAISNTQLYARLWRLSPDAKIDDGLLDIMVMEGMGFQDSAKFIAQVTLGSHVGQQNVHSLHASRIQIETKEKMHVHVDAEIMGETPVEIEVLHRSLNVILPQNVPQYHFSSQT